MKVLAIFLVVITVAAGHVIQDIQDRAAEGRSLSSQVVDFLEASKEQMPCGFPGLGVPPLAPLKAEHREVHIKGENFQLDGIVDKFRLNNFETFDIEEFKINALLSRVTWKFNWVNMNVNTAYDMDVTTNQQGLKVKVHRRGNAIMNLENLTIWGQAKYSLGVLSGNLRLKEFKLYVSLGKIKSEIDGLMDNKIMNRLLNEIIEEFIMISINENTDNMAIISNKYVVPIANDLIGDLSIGDIIGSIVGGGGGSGSDGEIVVKEQCIPPEISADDNGVWSFSFA